MSEIKAREVYCNARGKYVRVVNEVDHLAAIEQAKIDAVREFAQSVLDTAVAPKPNTEKGEYYRAALRHVGLYAEQYIKELSK